MIAPSTKPRPPIEKALSQLAGGASHYYLKSSSIVDTLQHNGRTFYSKFRRIDAPVNDILIRQHLRREITLALPLLRDDQGDKLVIEYLGDEPELFIRTLLRLFRHLQIQEYLLFQGKRPNRRTILLPQEPQELQRLHALGGKLSEMLQTRLSKSWRILPDIRLPEDYNIFTLPYGYIN